MSNPAYYENGIKESGFNGSGWYFNGEDYILYGPYLTKEEAEEALKEYCKNL